MAGQAIERAPRGGKTLRRPYAPMEALSVEEIPNGKQWQYEPKWDGFRCLVFRAGHSVDLQSKSGRSLTRYFPELVEAIAKITAEDFVLDGEIVVPRGKGFSFDDLLQRIHPAESRIRKLSVETPAILIIFDLLRDSGGNLTELSLDDRRSQLEVFARKQFRRRRLIRLSPATTKLSDAKKWLRQVGPVLDGIIAKRLDLPYQSGNREGMRKVKNYRSADCVVGGFRYNEGTKTVGSLLLGLYDDEGRLNHVGFTSSLKASEKKALTAKLERSIGAPGFTGDQPGGPSRWSTKRSAEWKPLKPKFVVEVRYDHFAGGRFRHGTQLLRWRPDKAPLQCTYGQLSQKKGNLFDLLT